MKMNRIVAWVDNAEKETIIKTNKNKNLIVFAKNKDDFIKKINLDSFPIISIKKANNINLVRKIVRSFPNIKFYALSRLDEAFTTPNEYSFIIDEPNVTNPNGGRSQYIASELIKLFEDQCITQQNNK